ncbi:hypothetical protein LMG7974_01606 [Campylobacter majalis]|uniref:Lipoprotein n=1 Tax=Campylobacter majalis TaxID=2790656 RepID=A0ABN7KBN0_9BACT|nr:hypothetical protein [Campylobacter majalis]CAD7289529.1 hypothetical protein LMG7974_01606 [Campylobacter majalis]
MKKWLAFFIFLLSAQTAFACLCIGEITQSFQKYEVELTKALKAQQKSLKKLQMNVEDTTSKLDEQNKLLSVENRIFKDEILKQQKLVFELTKKINLR